jgi:diguanylate cyclase (GGDEF)-like protein/PAS domain S-box-containing protein
LVQAENALSLIGPSPIVLGRAGTEEINSRSHGSAAHAGAAPRPWNKAVRSSLGLVGGLILAGMATATMTWAAGMAPSPALDLRLLLGTLVAALAAVSTRLTLLAATQDRALATLRQELGGLRGLCRNLSEGVFQSTLDGRMVFANPSLVRLNGYQSERQMLAAVNDIGAEWYVDPNRRAEIHAMLLEHGQLTGLVSEIYRHNTRERIWIEENVRLVRDPETGEPLYYDGTVREVTESVRRLELQSRYDKIGSMVTGCLYQYRMGPGGTFSVPYASVGLVHMTGLAPESLADDASPLIERIHPEDRERVRQSVLRSAAVLLPWQCEFRVCLPDGKQRWLFGQSVPERETDGGTLWHGFLTDVTERKQADATIHELAYFDPLTGLANRSMLRERLMAAVSPVEAFSRHYALIFIDLDRFKDLNDSKGHHVGDQFLCETARRLTRCVRTDDVVARLGGDEFVILLAGLSSGAAHAKAHVGIVAHKLLKTVGEPMLVDGSPFQTTASIGVAVFRSGSGDSDRHLKQADLAMYEAKAAGRGTIRFFAEAMQERVEGRLALTADLRAALAEERLTLLFQPQVDWNGRTFAAEALLRWTHPRRGLIPPREIIALADQNGLLGTLEEWVLEKACRTLRRWRLDPLMRTLKLAVNLTAQQLSRPDFVARLKAILARTGADPSHLTIELTESVRLNDIDQVGAVMLELGDSGISFALDDFGTGYSSLAYLRRLPLDVLKLDSSFTRDLEKSASDRTIIESIVKIARSLNVSVIAEGVETATQQLLLQQAGCTLFQGYAFGRPMSADDFTATVRETASTQILRPAHLRLAPSA